MYLMRNSTPGSDGGEYITDGNLGCSPIPVAGNVMAAYQALTGLSLVDLTSDQVGLIRTQVSDQQNNFIHWIVAAVSALPGATGELTADQITAAVKAAFPLSGTITLG